MSKRKLTGDELAAREQARKARRAAQTAIARIREERPDLIVRYIFEGLTLRQVIEMAGYQVSDFYPAPHSSDDNHA